MFSFYFRIYVLLKDMKETKKGTPMKIV